jgi:hypothetical protein
LTFGFNVGCFPWFVSTVLPENKPKIGSCSQKQLSNLESFISSQGMQFCASKKRKSLLAFCMNHSLDHSLKFFSTES